jgi:membrane protease YdiL (CAAX protease family)
MTYSIAALLAALLGPALIVTARQHRMFGAIGHRPRLLAAASLWAATILSGSLVGLSGRGSEAVGFVSPTWSALGWGLACGVIGLATFPIYLTLAKLLGLSGGAAAAAMAEVATVPPAARLFLLLTAGIAEEILFRAVPITVLADLTGSMALAVILPLTVFVVLHRASWGLIHLVFVTIAGAVMTAAFLWGGLWAAVLAHLVVDAPMMLFAPAIVGRLRKVRQAGTPGAI